MPGNEIPILEGIAGSCSGKTYRFQDDSASIGSAPSSNIRISGRLVSESHAVIERTPNGTFLLRNRSPHGTFVNRLRIDVHVLAVGDRIQIGEGGILEFRAGSTSAKSGAAQPSPRKSGAKRYVIIAALAVYLVAMGTFIAFLATQSSGDLGVSANSLSTSIAATRAQLLANDFAERRINGEVLPSGSSDVSAPYFALLAAIARGDSAESIGARVDSLLATVRSDFDDARILEQQERHKEAKRLYHRVLDELPDSRLPLAQLAAKRLTKLDEIEADGK
jgi:pSer/pThr/pTyr-binding forkhead associated (FHA) protein